MLWMAPECLREGKDRRVDKQKADIYALGIILKEIFTRSSPYTEYPFLVAHGKYFDVTTNTFKNLS
jgi:serine/threonine protein kinase